MMALNLDINEKMETLRSDREVQAYIAELISIVSFQPGESTVGLYLRKRRASQVERKLDTLLRAKYNISMDDVRELFEQRDAYLAEVAAASSE